MQIAFHIGAKCTDDDRLLKSLLKNTDVLRKQGIVVPGPGKYRNLIRDAVRAAIDAEPHPDSRDILLDAIVETDAPKRLVLCNDNFIAVPPRIFDNGVFYPQAEGKMRALHRLFAGDEISLFMGIRHPAGFLQDCMRQANLTELGAYLTMLPPEALRWSDVIRRIKQGAPDTPLTVWCNEDSPLIWDQLIRRLSGVSPETPVTGGNDMLANILHPDGLVALAEVLVEQPAASDTDRHEIIAGIWDDYVMPEAVEDVITLPELDEALVAHLSATFEADLATIDAMAGVDLIMPFR